jgi:hypothetical protein
VSNSVLFLLAVLVLSLAGGLLLWWRDRGPRSMEAHMRAFERELNALSPGYMTEDERRRHTSSRPRTRDPRSG